LVSKGAKYRYNRWLDDLKRVEVGTSEPVSFFPILLSRSFVA